MVTKIKTLQKKTFYLLGSFVALIAAYVIAENTHTTDTSVTGITIPEVFADIPSGDSLIIGGDDGGDGN